MTYSVWDGEKYHYYESAKAVGGTEAVPPKSFFSPRIGNSIEEASWKLPVGALKVGEGIQAKGIVVHSSTSSGLGGIEMSKLVKYGLIGVVAYVVYKKYVK